MLNEGATSSKYMVANCSKNIVDYAHNQCYTIMHTNLYRLGEPWPNR
jgi:hypothetical protein